MSLRGLAIISLLSAPLLLAGCGGGAAFIAEPAVNPRPSITNLSPSSTMAGAAAQTLTISGTGFLSTSTVTYNGQAHATTFVSSTQLTISLSDSDQAAAGNFSVVVTNPAPGGGASNSANFTVNDPAPVVTNVSPTFVLVNSTDTTLAITGTGFTRSSSVTFNNNPLQTTFVSATQLTAVLPAVDERTEGTFSLTVVNPAPGGGTSVAQQFKVFGASLAVNILHLPAGANASVSVTKPDNTVVNLTATQTIFGPEGTYTVAAAAVTVGSSTYHATLPNQMTIVASGDSSSVTVDYFTIIPNTTKVLDQTGMRTLQISPDGSTLTISATSAVAQSLQGGDVLASAPTSSAPHGLLKRILTVTPNGATVVATTSQAALPDAISRAHFVFTQSLGAAQLQSAAKGLSVSSRATGHKSRAANAIQDSCTGSTSLLMTLYSVQLAADQNGNSVTASGEAEVCYNLDFEVDIDLLPPQVTVAKAVASGAEHVHIGVEGRYSNSFSLKQTVATFSTLVVADIGGVPVVLEPSVDFYVGLDGNLNAGFSTGISEDAQLQEGVQYQSGQWSPIESLTTVFGEDPLSVDAALDVKGFAGAEVDVTIDGVLCPHLGADAYLKFNADINANPWWTLIGGTEGDVGIKVGILGLSQDFDDPDIFQFSRVLLQASGRLAPAPVLSTLSPNAAPINSPDLTLLLTGSNFAPGAYVSFNGSALQTAFVDAMDLTATLPARYLTTSGVFPVIVTNPDTAGATSTALNFTVSAQVQPTASCAVAPIPFAIVGVQVGVSAHPTRGTGGPYSATWVNGPSVTMDDGQPFNVANLACADVACSRTYTPTVTGGPYNSIQVTVKDSAGNASPASACPSYSVQDFNVSVSPNPLTFAVGSGGNFTVSANSINGFNGNVIFNLITTLPAGFSTATWSNNNCTPVPNGSCSVTVHFASTSFVGTVNPVTFTGTYQGFATRQASATLSVTAAPQFTVIDVPGAGTGPHDGTVALGINSNTAPSIAGIYWDSTHIAHGFVRAAGGTITTFDAPGADTLNRGGTLPFSIDNLGNITGTYFDSNFAAHGFVRAANGAITTFDVSGARCPGTVPISINSGVIAGMFWDANCVYHGFIRTANGAITSFDAPGAGTSNSLGTAAIGINSAGMVTGTYSDSNNGFHGFLRAANGTISTFNAPGAAAGTGIPPGTNSIFLGTIGLSINTAGDVAGTYTDANLVGHGFLRAASGTITTFDIPGAGTGMLQGTLALGLNDAGTIVGGYLDVGGVAHGFVRAADGTITTFSAPNAGTDMLVGTAGLSINALGAVAGSYRDANGVAHGFVVTP